MKKIDLKSECLENNASLSKIKIGGLEPKLLWKERNADPGALFWIVWWVMFFFRWTDALTDTRIIFILAYAGFTGCLI